MTFLKKTAYQPDVKNYSPPESGKLDAILGRIDLVAILTAVLGLCVLAVVAGVMAMIELAKLISNLWSDSFDRWLIIALSVAILWVAVRGKKLCVF
jgi:hypothetical protein